MGKGLIWNLIMTNKPSLKSQLEYIRCFIKVFDKTIYNDYVSYCVIFASNYKYDNYFKKIKNQPWANDCFIFVKSVSSEQDHYKTINSLYDNTNVYHWFSGWDKDNFRIKNEK